MTAARTAAATREHFAEQHARFVLELHPSAVARRACLAHMEASQGADYRADIERRMRRLWREGVRPLRARRAMPVGGLR